MSPFNPMKKTGLAALLEKEKESLAIREKEKTNALSKTGDEWADPKDMPERIRIIFDDSSSMSGSKLDDAKEGTVEFFKNCIANQTAVAVHPLEYISTDLTKLTTNLPALSVLVRGIPIQGSTPLFGTIKSAQLMEPKATRLIVFSDGAPDYYDQTSYEINVIEKAQEDRVPIDTVLIWNGSIRKGMTEEEKKTEENYMKESREYKTLSNLAERTGGYFMVFDRSKMDFKKGLKYLAPKNRLMLSSESVRKDIESGKLA